MPSPLPAGPGPTAPDPRSDTTPTPDFRPAPTAPPVAPHDAATLALADAVREIEEHVATSGWDAAPRLFALVSTARALAADPSLAHRLPPEVRASAADPHHLLSVEQEGFAGADLDDALARIAWPDSVDGVALTVERIVLPPSAEQDVPEDPAAALAYLTTHPARQDVRLAVGVLREGARWSALRIRADDAAGNNAGNAAGTTDPDDSARGDRPSGDVAFGPDLVPGLADALAATFED